MRAHVRVAQPDDLTQRQQWVVGDVPDDVLHRVVRHVVEAQEVRHRRLEFLVPELAQLQIVLRDARRVLQHHAFQVLPAEGGHGRQRHPGIGVAAGPHPVHAGSPDGGLHHFPAVLRGVQVGAVAVAMVEQLDPHRQMAVGHEGDEPPARLRRGRRLALVQISGREQAPELDGRDLRLESDFLGVGLVEEDVPHRLALDRYCQPLPEVGRAAVAGNDVLSVRPGGRVGTRAVAVDGFVAHASSSCGAAITMVTGIKSRRYGGMGQYRS